MTLKAKVDLAKMCGCLKRTYKRHEAKMEAIRHTKRFNHQLYIYKCPRSRFYHLTKNVQNG